MILGSLGIRRPSDPSGNEFVLATTFGDTSSYFYCERATWGLCVCNYACVYVRACGECVCICACLCAVLVRLFQRDWNDKVSKLLRIKLIILKKFAEKFGCTRVRVVLYAVSGWYIEYAHGAASTQHPAPSVFRTIAASSQLAVPTCRQCISACS